MYHLDKLKTLILRGQVHYLRSVDARLEDLRWRRSDFRDCFCAMTADDYTSSEWAATPQDLIACDIYKFAYDEAASRVVQLNDRCASVSLYMKFGLPVREDIPRIVFIRFQ